MARIGRECRNHRSGVVFGLLLVAGSSAFALAYPMVLGHDWRCQDQDGRLDFAVASRGGLLGGGGPVRRQRALGFVYESSRDLTALLLYPIMPASLVAVG
jgi:hypothetical protein